MSPRLHRSTPHYRPRRPTSQGSPTSWAIALAFIAVLTTIGLIFVKEYRHRSAEPEVSVSEPAGPIQSSGGTDATQGEQSSDPATDEFGLTPEQEAAVAEYRKWKSDWIQGELDKALAAGTDIDAATMDAFRKADEDFIKRSGLNPEQVNALNEGSRRAAMDVISQHLAENPDRQSQGRTESESAILGQKRLRIAIGPDLFEIVMKNDTLRAKIGPAFDEVVSENPGLLSNMRDHARQAEHWEAKLSDFDPSDDLFGEYRRLVEIKAMRKFHEDVAREYAAAIGGGIYMKMVRPRQ